MRKNLLATLITDNHPVFKEEPMKSILLANPEYFNVEHLVEATMAHVGGYDFVDANHYDFSDGSECKTGTIYQYPTTQFGEVSSCRSKAGTIKTGPVRAIMINPVEEKLHYIYIPNEVLVEKLSKNNRSSFRLSYSKKTKDFTNYCVNHGCIEFDTFEELANA